MTSFMEYIHDLMLHNVVCTKWHIIVKPFVKVYDYVVKCLSICFEICETRKLGQMKVDIY
jgi:hypothetical protein